MTERSDVIVIGLGPGGEEAAGRLLDAGKKVTVIERELIGGECAYWACIPSKTLLRAPEAQRAASHTAGTSRPEIDWAALRDYRDYMVRHYDDGGQVEQYEGRGARVVKGDAQLVGPGQVEVNGARFEAEQVIVATGSRPIIPAVEGMDGAGIWTNREATALTEIPSSAVVVGGSAVGIELGQFLARMGCAVTVVHRDERLLPREEPRVGALIGERFATDRIAVRLGRQPKAVHRDAGQLRVELDDGTSLASEVVVLGVGRRPNSEGLGLERLGVSPTQQGAIPIDAHCRAAPGLFAVGDVTGVALFTHVATYQGRVAADNILGRSRVASYEGVPRVVFADPEIGAVGLTAAQAAERGIETLAGEVDLAATISRPWTYETNPEGHLGVLVDRERRVLVGAWAVAPLASEWIHHAAQAIRARLPIEVLVDEIAQFPTYNEAYVKALESLAW